MMGYNTQSTEWPSIPILEAKKQQHHDKFFSIMDRYAPDTGGLLADDIFAHDGELHGHQVFQGQKVYFVNRLY